MSRRIDTQANNAAIRLTNQSGNPSSPGAGYGLLFSKADGVYFESQSGTVVGPLVAQAAASIPSNGWIAEPNTWNYLSADSPSFVASINANVTGTILPGTKVKLTQTTEKFFFVTATSITGSTTYVNMYGGTDYSLANASISSPYYSPVKAPLGFPLDPAKWTVSVTDTGARSQGSPTQNTWYNINSMNISIPIGCWYVGYSVNIGVDRAAAGGVSASVTLSTANNTESDATMSGNIYAINVTYLGAQVTKSAVLTLASKTVYYLNTRTILASQTDLYNQNAFATLVISAVCAYL